MAFSLMPATGSAPPRSRERIRATSTINSTTPSPYSAKNGSPVREKASRIGLLSVILIIYSGVALGLIVWNQTASNGMSEAPHAKETGRGPTIADTPGAESLRPPKLGGRGTSGSGNEHYGGLRDSKKFRSRDATEYNDTGKLPSDAITDEQVQGVGWVPGDEAKGDSEYVSIAAGERATGGAAGDGLIGADGPGAGAGGGAGLLAPGLLPGGRSESGRDDGRIPNHAAGQWVEGGKSQGGDDLTVSPPMEGPFDVTLVSQTSHNRFWMLPFLCQRWPGPISIAILEEDRKSLPDDLCSHMMISATWAQTPEELDPAWYPVNRLRNVAVRAVQTSHFLMTDIDIWPDVHAYQALHVRYEMEKERIDDARNAIVFTAFSRRRFCEADKCLEYARNVPETIAELKPCLETNTCGRFDAANQSGQGTAYVYYWRSMLRQPNQRTLEHIVCFKSNRFEPYLVVRKSSILPTFDERFTGYGKNKIQWINHLRYSGFRFFVMPVNFVIHAPHPKSVAKSVWEKTGGGKQGRGDKLMDIAFGEFMVELRKEKGEEGIVTQLCQAKAKSSGKGRKDAPARRESQPGPHGEGS